MLDDRQLEMIKEEMEKGVPIPRTLEAKGWDVPVNDVRGQLFEKHGREAIRQIIRDKIIRGASFGRRLERVLERALSIPNLTPENIDGMLAAVQDALVRLNARKAELTDAGKKGESPSKAKRKAKSERKKK